MKNQIIYSPKTQPVLSFSVDYPMKISPPGDCELKTEKTPERHDEKPTSTDYRKVTVLHRENSGAIWMAGRQRLSLSPRLGVQQFLGGGTTMLDAARSFLVVPVGEEPRHATILDGAYRARTLGGAFRSRVRCHHSAAVATVFRYAVHDL